MLCLWSIKLVVPEQRQRDLLHPRIPEAIPMKTSTRTRSRTLHLTIAVACVLFIYSGAVLADAIVRTQAMFADTIAEYFVEDDLVRLELEIGQNDVSAFRNLLPDDIYQRLGYGEAPLAQRLKTFTTQDMVVLAGESPLKGVFTKLGPGTRPLRDRITSEVVPTPEDQAAVVIRATILYPFEKRPDALTLVAPRKNGQANIGFVVYHKGIAVNDYRYLASGFTVHLDWQDPWYSSFPQRGLRRQYFSPMTGFIYVEPYEVRKEIILRPSDVQRIVDLGLDGKDTISADRHDDIKQKVVAFLSDHFPVTIDGVAVEGTVDRVNFLKRTLRSSIVVDGQDLDLWSATLGVIYYFPTDGLPQRVEMEWDIFTDKMQMVPAATVDQAGPLPTMLEPDANILRWDNFLRFPELPTLNEIAPPPTVLQRIAKWARWIATAATIGLGALLLIRFRRQRRVAPATAVVLLCTVAIAVVSFTQFRRSSLDDERLQELVGNLLHNVYLAFDYRGEEVIYDVLAKSVAGDLLTEIYLETQKSLELANQGGARVKVKSTTVDEAELLGREGNHLDIQTSWTVSGSVGHWGHVHQRTNGYRANLQISDVDGAWKLTRLEVLDEQRL